MQMHEDESEASGDGQVREGLDHCLFEPECSSSDVLSNISRYHYDDMANTTIFDRLIRDLRHGTSSKEEVCRAVCSSSDVNSTGSVSDAPVYHCNMYACGESFTDLAELSKHKKLHDDETSDEFVKNHPIVVDSSSSSDEERYSPVVDTRSLIERVRDIRRRNDARDAGIIPEKQELRESRRSKPPVQQIAESDLLSLSGSSDAPVYHCCLCGSNFTDHTEFKKHMQAHDDNTSHDVRCDEVVGVDIPLPKRKRVSEKRGSLYDEMWSSNQTQIDELLQSLRDTLLANKTGTSSNVGSATEHSASDAYASASDSASETSDAPTYHCCLCGSNFTDHIEFKKHMQVHDDTTDEESVAEHPVVVDSSSSSEEELSNPIIEWRSLSQRLQELERRTRAHHPAEEHPRLPTESHIATEMTKWGLTIATRVTMPASRNGWLTDTSRVYSEVDIIVMDVTACILLLEVDENAHQHPSYTLTCELSRMLDVNAYLRLQGHTRPIYWLRFSPYGSYFVGDEERFGSWEQREKSLKKHILSMREPGFVPKGDENIHYMFYSRESENGPPKILENPDYPDILKQVVTWGE